MAYNYEYPYTNSQRYNDDWLIHTIQDLEKTIANFVSLNTIKYANPLQWDIRTQYQNNTLVQDVDGSAYLSVKLVPSGVLLTDTNYWTPILDLKTSSGLIRKNIAVADEGVSRTATAPRSVGELVWLNNNLYEVIAPMIAGDTYVVDSNVKKVTIESLLASINEKIKENSESITEITSKLPKLTRDIYLDTTGDDSNDGTLGHPIKTFTKACELSVGNNTSVWHITSGEYDGVVISSLNIQLRASGRVTINGDFVLRRGSYVLIGTDSQATKDEATYHFTNGINGIYINGSELVTNCPLEFSNVTNAIISDCGSTFSTHEYNTTLTMLANVANGLEASRSECLGGNIIGSVTDTMFKSYGGFMTIQSIDNVTASSNLYNTADGGIISVVGGNVMNNQAQIYINASGTSGASGSQSNAVPTIAEGLKIAKLYANRGNYPVLHIASGTYQATPLNNDRYQVSVDGDVVLTGAQVVRFGSSVQFVGSGTLTINAPNDNCLFIAENSRVELGVATILNGNVGLFVATNSSVGASTWDTRITASVTDQAIFCQRSNVYIGILEGTNVTALQAQGGSITYSQNNSTSSGTAIVQQDGGRIYTGTN